MVDRIDLLAVVARPGEGYLEAAIFFKRVERRLDHGRDERGNGVDTHERQRHEHRHGDAVEVFQTDRSDGREPEQ